MKKFRIIPLGVISFILIFPFVFSLIRPWTNIKCTKEHIDIDIGLIRTQKYYLFLKYSDKTESTYLSKLLGIDSVKNPQWRIVNTFSFGRRYSPHYSFHGALGQITKLKLMISL